MIFGKLINEKIEYAPYYLKKEGKDIFNYNLETNSKMLYTDGYKEVIDTFQPSGLINPKKIWQETETQIIAKWIDTYIEPTLEELKQQKYIEINEMRDRTEQGGFEYMGKIFDSDSISCQRISCAAQALQFMHLNNSGEVPTITWTCADNSHIKLTALDLAGLVVALADHSNKCHEKATKLKELIKNAQTKEELDKIVW